MTTLELREDERQAIMLGLARLALERPGWRPYIRTIAQHAGAEVLYDELLKTGEREARGLLTSSDTARPRLGTCLTCQRRAFVVVDDPPPPIAPHPFVRAKTDPGRMPDDMPNAACDVCHRPRREHAS